MAPLLVMARRLRASLLILFLFGGGCRPAAPPGPLVRAGMYHDSPDELQRLWRDILLACQKDDRPRVHDLMSSFILTQPELTELLGPAQSQALWPRYQAMLGSLVNTGAVGLVAHVYEKKYDDIVVNRIDNLPAAELAETDSNVVHALRSARPFYTVRVKKQTEKSGLRYDFFVYINGYWRSGNLLGKFLPPAAVAVPPSPAVAPLAVPPAVSPPPAVPPRP